MLAKKHGRPARLSLGNLSGRLKPPADHLAALVQTLCAVLELGGGEQIAVFANSHRPTDDFHLAVRLGE